MTDFHEQLFKAAKCYVAFLHKVPSVGSSVCTCALKDKYLEINVSVSQINKLTKKLAAIILASSSVELLATKFFVVLQNKILDEALKSRVIIHQTHQGINHFKMIKK